MRTLDEIFRSPSISERAFSRSSFARARARTIRYSAFARIGKSFTVGNLLYDTASGVYSHARLQSVYTKRKCTDLRATTKARSPPSPARKSKIRKRKESVSHRYTFWRASGPRAKRDKYIYLMYVVYFVCFHSYRCEFVS